MRQLVPFVGEQKIVRADDELARAKRSSGRVIDEVVGAGPTPSSWEDTVPSDHLEKPAGKPGGGILRPPAMPRAPNPLTAPVVTKPAMKASGTRSSTIVYSDKPSLEWVPIHSGRGLRISVRGSIDHNLREEWRRLLEETEHNGIGEFEFNLIETPALSLTGLGMLLLFKEHKGSAREAITLCNCNSDVAKILHWSGMDKYFVIQPLQPVES